MKMKKMISLLMAVVMAMGMTACGGSSNEGTTAAPASGDAGTEAAAQPAADAKVCKIGLTCTSNHGYVKGIQYMGELIKEKTNGSVVCEFFYDGSMGTDPEVIQAMQMGTMDGVLCSTNTFSIFAPALECFDLPGLYPTIDIAYAVADSEIGKELLGSLDGTGVTGMGYYDGGYYYLTNDKVPVTTMDQLAGIKVRSQEATVQLKTWECLKMSPTVMSFSELFTALQQGVIDAQANIAANLVSTKIYEVQQYVTEFPMLYMMMIIAFSDSFLNSLTPEERTAVEEAVAEAIQWQRENYPPYVEECMQTIRDNGNQVLTLEDGEIEKMVEACQPVYDYARETHGDIVDRILEAAEAAK